MPLAAPPLSLYIHIPWCVKKCPYCDFNSHGLRGELQTGPYIEALFADLEGDLADLAGALRGRTVDSIFLGGGTPSLFPPKEIGRILDGVASRLTIAAGAEITMETNPGTVEHGRLGDYLVAGVNRLSFGVQSFDDDKLKRLGRIHSADEARRAIARARADGFANINLDLMYALPTQDLAGALSDVEQAIALAPTHISHYQLTLEPNTLFAARPPPLPDTDLAWDMQEQCQQRLAQAGYEHYEVSAYAQPGARCMHNINYWSFGDYLAIGAGAHGKITDVAAQQVERRWKQRTPRSFMQHAATPRRLGGRAIVAPDDLAFEYMLNALRLIDGTSWRDFHARTGLGRQDIAAPLDQALRHGWLHDDAQRLQTTDSGQRFLNDVMALFLPDAPPTS